MRTKIVAAFPGTGVIETTRKLNEFGLPNVWLNESIYRDNREGSYKPVVPKDGFVDYNDRDKTFVENYVQIIKELVEANELAFVFITTNRKVRSKLLELGIEFTVVYPSKDQRVEYIDRLNVKCKGGYCPGSFVKLVGVSWETWIDSIEDDRRLDVIRLDHRVFNLLDYVKTVKF